MSRERVFVWIVHHVLVPIAIVGQAAIVGYAVLREPARQHAPAQETAPEAKQDLGSIFSCRSEGAEVLVSLGQGNRSIYWVCNEVKP